MPRDDGTSLRNAASQIASSGLADDVIHTGGADVTQRQNRRDAADSQGERKPKPKLQERKEAPVDEPEYGDDEPDYDEDADADNSNPDTEEPDDDGDDASEAEGDDDREEGDEPEGDEPNPDDAKHVVKVQGKQFEVTLGELKAGYQRGKDYQLKTHSLGKATRELIDGHKKRAEDYAGKVVQLEGITNGLRKLIVGDMDSAEMRQLRHSDPNQWAFQRERMNEQLAVFDKVIEGLRSESKQHLDSLTQRQKDDLKTLAIAETDKLVRAIPDWFTPDREGQENGATRVTKFLTKAGFTQDEINNVYDSRMFIVAELARRYIESAQRAQQAKRVKKVPQKIVKPGKTQIQTTKAAGGGNPLRSGSFRKDAANAKKSGDMRDAGRAIAHLLK